MRLKVMLKKNVELLLIGNKNDLNEEKMVSTDMGKKYADSKNMEHFEASAKTADCVNNAFLSLARKLMSKRD